MSFIFPYLVTLLNAPITLFEIFPFIFLISTQFLFFDLFQKDELSLLKVNGLSNIKIIKILSYISFFIGIISILIFYNAASKLKFFYTDIKNDYSLNNRYLAVVTESGLWLKDETKKSTLIVKALNMKDKYLLNVIINEFDENFNLINTIQSDKVNINDKLWIIEKPSFSKENITTNFDENLSFQTSFDKEKINNLFSNIYTLNLLELFDLKKNYENLGYSSSEIKLHLLGLFSTPVLYTILTILSAIIMFNFSKNRSLFFHIIFGVLMSVIIYYINFIFNSLGDNGKIPIIASIFLPLILISIVVIIGLIRINEK